MSIVSESVRARVVAQAGGICEYCRYKATGIRTDVYGIVSNGQGWVFYRWTADDSELSRTALFGIHALPNLLGALDHICAACDAQISATKNMF